MESTHPQIEVLEENLSEGFKEQKDRYIAELKSILDRKRSIMKKRLQCLQSALCFSVCKKTLSSLFEARQFQLEEFKTDLSQQEQELEKLQKQEEEITREIEQTKEKLKTMRAFVYTQSGLFHCGNNPNPNDWSCLCGTEKCQEMEKTPLFEEVISKEFDQDRDACYVRIVGTVER